METKNTAEIIRELESVEKEQQGLDERQTRLTERRERLLNELAESLDTDKFIFNRSCLSVSWTGGKIRFTEKGERYFKVLKALMNKEGEWQPAPTYAAGLNQDKTLSLLYRLDEKLRLNGFPRTIDIKRGKVRITK